MESNSAYQVRVNRNLKDEFRKIAKKNGTDGSALIREYMENYVKENSDDKKEK